MVLRRPLIALTLIAVVLITLLVVQRVTLDASTTSPRPLASTPAATPTPAGIADSISTTFSGPAYDPAVARGPTREKPQSKLWYHDGLWWGSLFDNERRAFTIWWLDAGHHEWMNTGTVIDDRSFARQDALWDGEVLTTASHGSGQASERHSVQIKRFTYDPDARRWLAAPNFPISVTPAGVEAASLARDGSGRLWAAYIVSQRVGVIAAERGDLVWSEPYYFDERIGAVEVDQVAIVAVGGDIGVIWSNQIRDGVFFNLHRAGNPIDRWEEPEMALSGLKAADDHISVRSLAGPGGDWVYAAAKTSLDEAENFNPLAPQVLVLARSPDGEWTQHAFGRVEDHHTRPILMLDAERREAMVFATSPFDGGTIYLKRSPLDRISFPVGLGTPVITTDQDPVINNATATHQTVSIESGLVILAADDTLGQYMHVELSVNPDTAEVTPAVASTTAVVNTTFDGMIPGHDLTTQGFLVTPVETGAASVAAAGQAWVARVSSTDGGPVRICRRFSPVASGTLAAAVRVLIEHPPIGDAPLVAMRGAGEEVSGLRILADGSWAYRDGPDRVVTEAAWAPAVWYRVTITADVASRTYATEVRDDAGQVVLNLGGLTWLAAPAELDEVCVQAPRAAGSTVMLMDEIVITHAETP